MQTLIPAPKSFTLRPGVLGLGAPGSAVTVRSDSVAAGSVADWLGQRLTSDHGIRPAMGDDGGPQIQLQILTQADVGSSGFADSPAFCTTIGQEQGYVLEVSQDAAEIAAMSPHGLQNGAATLLQLLHTADGRVEAPCCRVEDGPDVRFRAAADWLLNAEINRWGYERGDGLEATIARMKRKLDQAAAYKINVVWFDGFGWDPDRTSWYADFVRELTDYAGERHIRLAFSGYGGGYGAAYQPGSLYSGRYHGHAFRNRNSYPDGEPYDCVGHPAYPTSWTYGTCLSNAALAKLKLAELTNFVARCRPGVMYIHDIDTGGIVSSLDGWTRRCPQCKARWPDDEMASAKGAAGGYGHWFRQVVQAINAISTDDGQYSAARDCEIMFIGPTYSGFQDSDDLWTDYCDYCSVLSCCVGPAPNVEFGIREQFVSDTPPGCRVPMLRSALDEAGCGHGVFVVPFVGGDNFYSDQLVTTVGALHSYWQGAETVYVSSMGSVGEPGQLLCANYAWHAAAPGAYVPAGTRAEALELRGRCATGVETQDDLLGSSGLLGAACKRLYGSEAGPLMAELFSLGAGHGVFPLATGWRQAADEAAALEAGTEDEDGSQTRYWRQREELTSMALKLGCEALEKALPSEGVREDVAWLCTGLNVGRRICQALRAGREWQADKAGETREQFDAAVSDLRAYLDANVPGPTTDPVGGDVAIWNMVVDRLDVLSN
ncbi:MAG: hypothetical protein HN742_34170 [Lentisphaerae bacterium]|jgi:hypothetical protein|nr:hypothetical protein [Lentisphaerota bacterium]MBT4819942.1 hypothetical protein [Lentisphaerota bacterium]MBT5612925.1 hypothetical protein [Lentisphaerota bacterium]MBT7061857.1 hypothetical protein [Lentisphaerota bacterium]MBT7846969.1 hypothetical protein [Lentisphaerota bacterium]